MQTTIYQNNDYFLLRKPHGVPSTFGEQESFLDVVKNNMSEKCLVWTPLSQLVPEDVFSFISSRLTSSEGIEKWKDWKMERWEMEDMLRQQVETFGEDQEFGLLNRLDNDTAGFLYFAKSKKAFDEFKWLQKSDKVKKFYIAQIFWEWKNGNMEKWKYGWTTKTSFHINSPIMHHKSADERMVVIRDDKDVSKGRGKLHEVETHVSLLHYDAEKNISTLEIMITKWIRHQIRVHLASVGCPIIGDELYGNGWWELRLRSVGFSSEASMEDG